MYVEVQLKFELQLEPFAFELKQNMHQIGTAESDFTIQKSVGKTVEEQEPSFVVTNQRAETMLARNACCDELYEPKR